MNADILNDLAARVEAGVGNMLVWPDGPNDETTLRELLESSFLSDSDILSRAAAIAVAVICGDSPAQSGNDVAHAAIAKENEGG